MALGKSLASVMPLSLLCPPDCPVAPKLLSSASDRLRLCSILSNSLEIS